MVIQRLSVIRTLFRIVAPWAVMAGSLIPLTAVLSEAAQPITVTVLPFTINASKDLDYLSTQIADVLADHFKRNGAAIVQLHLTRSGISWKKAWTDSVAKRSNEHSKPSGLSGAV